MSPPRALNISWYKLGSQGIFVSGLKSRLEVIHNNVWSYFLLIKTLIRQFVKENFHNFWVAKVPVSIFLCAQQFWMFSVHVAEGLLQEAPLGFDQCANRVLSDYLWFLFFQSFGKIHGPFIQVFWVNHFLHFMQIWVIVEQWGEMCSLETHFQALIYLVRHTTFISLTT